MNLINLTPHTINLRGPDGSDTAVAASGTIARVTSTPGAPAAVAGIPVPVFGRDTYGEVTGLPAPAEGTLYIVSAPVGGAVAGTRDDILVPGTGPQDGAIRDDGGRIVAVTRLKRV
jgi:hypothetical protein